MTITFSTIGKVKPKFKGDVRIKEQEIPEIIEKLKDIKEEKPTEQEPFLIDVGDGQFYSIYYKEDGKLYINWLAPIMVLKED